MTAVRVLMFITLWCCWVLGLGHAWAGSADAVLQLNMEEVITLTLKQNLAIQIKSEEVAIGQGLLQATSGEFDWVVGGQGKAKRLRQAQPGEPLTTSRAEQLAYTVGLSHKFRSGISVEPNLAVVVAEDVIEGQESSIGRVGQAEVAFNIVVPLLRGWGSASAAADETAARDDLASRQLSYQHEIAVQLRNALLAYWDAVATRYFLDILKQTEQRALEIQRVVETFVASKLFSRAFVDQATANAGEKQALRLQGELDFYRARQSLALTLGLSPAALEQPPVPVDPLPPAEAPRLPDKKGISSLMQLAFEQRQDYRAAQKDRDALRILEIASKRDLKPRLDFEMRAGYTGLNTGSNLVSPLVEHSRGVNVEGTLSMDLPIWNDTFKGLYAESRARRRQADSVRQQLSQVIASDVLVALEAVKVHFNRVSVTRQAELAYQRALDKEKKRFRVGDTTLLDVLSLEDRYATAQLDAIDAHRRYVNALIQLRFATGSLVVGSPEASSVPVSTLLTTPLLP